jgi:hypothetical protein
MHATVENAENHRIGECAASCDCEGGILGTPIVQVHTHPICIISPFRCCRLDAGYLGRLNSQLTA